MQKGRRKKKWTLNLKARRSFRTFAKKLPDRRLVLVVPFIKQDRTPDIEYYCKLVVKFIRGETITLESERSDRMDEIQEWARVAEAELREILEEFRQGLSLT